MTPRDYRPLRRQMLRCDECDASERALRWCGLALAAVGMGIALWALALETARVLQ